MKYKAIIFDLDGTLLNTLDDLTDSVNYTLDTWGYPHHTGDVLKFFIGDGFNVLVGNALPGKFDDEHYQEALKIFREHYAVNCTVKTRPYDGVLELFEELRRRGHKFGVVSNKGDAAVKELVKANFGDAIPVVIGERPDVRRKPAPDTVLTALRELGETPENAVYVGDSEFDLLTAENAKMDCIAVSWGFRGRERLEELGAKIIIDDPAEMLDIV